MHDSNVMTSYSGPTAQLLSLDKPNIEGREFEDYPAHGLGAGDVSELIRMATDIALHDSDGDDGVSWLCRPEVVRDA